jgi:hypothetical protein
MRASCPVGDLPAREPMFRSLDGARLDLAAKALERTPFRRQRRRRSALMLGFDWILVVRGGQQSCS